MRLPAQGIRTAAIAAVLAVGAALTGPVTAHADNGSKPVRLTAAALARLSARYTPSTDGSAIQEALVAKDSTASTAAAAATAKPQASSSASAPVAAAGATTFQNEGSWETTQGVVRTLALGGTADWVGVSTAGEISRSTASGARVWDRTSHSLYADWGVKNKVVYQSQEYLPQLYAGYNPYQPSTTGQHPYLSADFNHDGTDDIAVAYSVGSSPARPFTVAGSTLSSGTFVTVLDGRDGHTLYSKLFPGYVGNMTVADGRLIVANRTGYDWYGNPVAEQGDSRSSLTALQLTPGADGTLQGSVAWTYSTNAPWAYWTDVESAGGDRIAAAWTDTPMGLGDPRPADGHVMLLDARTGKVGYDVKTAEYPRMLIKDPNANRLLVVEQNDPLDEVRWDLAAFSLGDGSRGVLATRDNTVPVALRVADSPARGGLAYAVSEQGLNADLSEGSRTVSGWDSKGRTLWTRTDSSTVGGAYVATGALLISGDTVVDAVSDPVPDTPQHPAGPEHTQLLGLDSRTGKVRWSRDGAVATADGLTPYRGGVLTVGYDETAYQVDPHSGQAAARPLLGDAYTAVAADVNHDGVQDLVVGGASRGVFALDGRTLKDAVPRILWTATVSGQVNQLQVARLGHGRAQQVVVAATGGVAVLDLASGRTRSTISLGSAVVGSVTVAPRPDGGSELLVPTDTVTAYRADGSRLWSYRPGGDPVNFADVVLDGAGHAITSSSRPRSSGTGAADPTAVSLDLADGHAVWTAKPDDPHADSATLDGGVYLSKDIPGADGHGVAFAWGGNGASLNDDHLVEIRDSRTGALVTSQVSDGASTFDGFVSSPTTGLVELHSYEVTVFPPTGAAYDVNLNLDPRSGAFVRTVQGGQSLVTASGGLFTWDPAMPDLDGEYAEFTAEDFALYAQNLTTVQLTPGSDDVVGLTVNMRLSDLLQQNSGFGWYDTDAYRHGISVYQVSTAAAATGAASGTSAASGTGATLKAQAAPQAETVPWQSQNVRGDTRVSDPALGTGTATPNVIVDSSTAVTPAATAADTAAEPVKGYVPAQITAHLGLKGDGAGQAIAIVDAYHYATATDDLNHFSARFGLPQTCGSAGAGDDCFTFHQSYAGTGQPPVDAGWNEEEALDIEWAHAVAPKATIDLVEADDAGAAALYHAVDVAAALHPAVVSNSWGMTEFSEEGYYDQHCALTSAVCTQSTGDAGWPSGYSATSSYALAIGGTTLHLDAGGALTAPETAWRSTGGGQSFFEQRPAYQDGVQSSAFRGTPDVSFLADPATGVAVFTSASGTPTWMQVGGTSLSAPSWAGILASADQLRAAAGKAPLAAVGADGDTVHKAVYGLGSALFDVVSGSNGRCGAQCTAGPGYDFTTGLGSPRAGVDAALAAE
ncbi:hypothetical protein ABUW04_21840 [Streptacidiphilus sp. N1-10]|uniref:Peptidase S53 domain-containing protein n=1 Tax=Streptacidiphilus jeojiensis TaxID=3229225 RepID=A0ABV6XRK2_9ACTN